ncbi:hypothetical protein [Spirosoma gilvum]
MWHRRWVSVKHLSTTPTAERWKLRYEQQFSSQLLDVLIENQRLLQRVSQLEMDRTAEAVRDYRNRSDLVVPIDVDISPDRAALAVRIHVQKREKAV